MRRCDVRVRLMFLCIEAWLLVPLFAVSLRLVPGPVLRRLRHMRSGSADRPELAGQVGAAIQRAAVCLPARAATCLPRACASHVMLARRGAMSRLRIGVMKTTGGMSAHAWVEAGDVVLGRDAESPQFMTLPVS